MQEKGIFREMVTHLSTCLEKFEVEMQESLSNMFDDDIPIQRRMFIENAKNYHYTEILKHINIIKLQLESIKFHDEKLIYLNGNPNQTDYYNNINNKTRLEEIQYVKQQVKNFSLDPNQEIIHQREKRPIRHHNESSMKYLTIWERFLEHQKVENDKISVKSFNGNVARKRMDQSKRKHAKIISSTYNDILDIDYTPDKHETDWHIAQENYNNNDIDIIKEDSSIDRVKLDTNEIELRGKISNDGHDRSSEDYFSDIFENCDDLIEIINRKSYECRKNDTKATDYDNTIESRNKYLEESIRDPSNRKVSGGVRNHQRDSSQLTGQLLVINEHRYDNEGLQEKEISYCNRSTDQIKCLPGDNTSSSICDIPELCHSYNIKKCNSEQAISRSNQDEMREVTEADGSIDTKSTKPRIVDVVYKKKNNTV